MSKYTKELLNKLSELILEDDGDDPEVYFVEEFTETVVRKKYSRVPVSLA